MNVNFKFNLGGTNIVIIIWLVIIKNVREGKVYLNFKIFGLGGKLYYK